MYIGAHIASNPKYLVKSSQIIKENGGNLVQIFVDPFKLTRSPYKEYYNQFKTYIKTNKIKCVVHASYTINLSRDWDLYSGSLQQFILQANAAHELGAEAIVVHMGKKMELSKEEVL